MLKAKPDGIPRDRLVRELDLGGIRIGTDHLLRIIGDAPAAEERRQVAGNIGRGAVHHPHLPALPLVVLRLRIDRDKHRLAAEQELVDGELQLPGQPLG